MSKKSKPDKSAKKLQVQLTEADYSELVKEADAAIKILVPLRWKARCLREDIDAKQQEIKAIQENVSQYITETDRLIALKAEKLENLRNEVEKEIKKVENETADFLEEVEQKKEDIERKRYETAGESEFLRVQLADLETCRHQEAKQRQELSELMKESENVVFSQKAEFNVTKRELTKNLREIRRNYNKNIRSATQEASRMIRPALVQTIEHIRDSNSHLAYRLGRASKKQNALFLEAERLRELNKILIYQYELWQDINKKRVEKCKTKDNLLLSFTSGATTEGKYVQLIQSNEVEIIHKREVPTYRALKRFLRDLLSPGEQCSSSEESEEENLEVSDWVPDINMQREAFKKKEKSTKNKKPKLRIGNETEEYEEDSEEY